MLERRDKWWWIKILGQTAISQTRYNGVASTCSPDGTRCGTHTHTHTYSRAHTHIYTYTLAHTLSHVHVHAHTHKHKYFPLPPSYTHTHTHTHIHSFSRTPTLCLAAAQFLVLPLIYLCCLFTDARRHSVLVLKLLTFQLQAHKGRVCTYVLLCVQSHTFYCAYSHVLTEQS